MSGVKLIHKFRTLKIQKPIDVACHGNGNPHIVKIDKFYLINNIAYAYCREHDLLFHIDSKKKPLEGFGR